MRIGDDLDLEVVDHSEELTQIVTLESVECRLAQEELRAERNHAKESLHEIKRSLDAPSAVLTTYQPPSYDWAGAIAAGIILGLFALQWIFSMPIIAMDW